VAIDFEKFIKLMMMTTSDHDHEALVALRKANAMLDSVDRNWEELLRGKVTMQVPWPSSGKSSQRHTDAGEINAMFSELMTTVPYNSSFRVFIEDVHDWWERKGFLTNAQYNALKRSIQRTRAS
jgi:hypothetical protein